MSNYLKLSWDTFASDTHELCDLLLQQNRDWRFLVAIARGGLVPATIVSHKLGIRSIDTICINSYDDSTLKQHDVKILKELRDDAQDILVIDDLVDSGKTFNLVRQMLPKAYFSSVYAKPNGKPSTDTYSKEIPQDTWIVFPWEDSTELETAVA